MKLDGWERQTMSFDGAISALAGVDRWEDVVDVLQWMNLDQVDKSPYTYKLAIGALDDHNQTALAGEIYLEALRDGYYSPWVPKSRLMDLRGFSLPLAKVALKTVLLSMIDGKQPVFMLKMVVGSVVGEGDGGGGEAGGRAGGEDPDPEISNTFDVPALQRYLRELSLGGEFPSATHTSDVEHIDEEGGEEHVLWAERRFEEGRDVLVISRDSLLAWIGDAE
ncbi:hypothetical protein B484DRAFT_20898 [Ochromonadaceae sp. CCMP2298]|nr:hypothetical protein B484DRAFT_20898 [Ochromonadaceae sp. CCMP2298]